MAGPFGIAQPIGSGFGGLTALNQSPLFRPLGAFGTAPGSLAQAQQAAAAGGFQGVAPDSSLLDSGMGAGAPVGIPTLPAAPRPSGMAPNTMTPPAASGSDAAAGMTTGGAGVGATSGKPLSWPQLLQAYASMRGGMGGLGSSMESIFARLFGRPAPPSAPAPNFSATQGYLVGNGTPGAPFAAGGVLIPPPAMNNNGVLGNWS